MKTRLKGLLGIWLAVIMMVGMVIPAAAADNPQNYPNISGSGSGVIYMAPSTNGNYKLMSGGQEIQAANPNMNITIVPIPDQGYTLDSISVLLGDESIPLTNNSFIMGDYYSSYTIKVTFKQILNTLTKNDSTNGSFTLMANGNPADSAAAGDEITIVPSPNAGYQLDTITVFKTDDPNITVNVSDGKFTMPDYPITFNVTFKQDIPAPVERNITLRYGDGTTKQFSASELIAPPEGKDIEGMFFCGWYDDAALTKPHDFTKPLTEDLTLYAKYAKIPTRYKVSFTADGKLVGIVLYKPSQDDLTFLPKVPKKEGYVGTWEAYTLNGKNMVVRAVYIKE